MYRIVILFTLATHFLFCATSQQVDQYMSTTHSDRELIEVEQMFSNLSNTMNLSDDNISNQITLDYQIYLGKQISKDEMEELLALYRKPIMQQYVNEMDMVDIPEDEMENFLVTLKEEPLSSERQDVIDELLKSILNEDLLLDFYESMMQRYTIMDNDENKSKEKKSTTTQKPSKEAKRFLGIIKKELEHELLYGTQILSMEEIKQVNEIMKSSVVSKARKVENEAIIEIMNNFIKQILLEAKKVEKK